MESLVQEVRQTIRVLARQPGFVVVAVLSLALGLGINTAVFSVMDALLLKPPAVRDLDRTVYITHATRETADRGTSFPAFLDYRARTDLFAETMAMSGSRPLLM